MYLNGLSKAAAGAAAAPGTTTHGPAAEALLEEAEYDVETEGAAEAPEAAAAATGVRPPRRSNWGDMSRRQRHKWKLRAGRPQCGSCNGGTWSSR